ncbi:hypothetical protein MN869_12440 [Acinetobacter sp. NIPH1876]|uniref:hypothetical protein n=1 Tax=unclassified Acinetobacter TaxID=196816 RepID=UPI001FAC05FE|nr:hypothetical protein [Acinetobacter sp. NIPH1876]MCJ0829251.1 hypothetical protein [Acinetobacter sp. NIPH1876]
MKKIFLTSLIGIVLLASGCSTTMPINYIASPSIRGQGDIGVGVFKYIPAEKGLVKQNEFQKPAAAIGSMYMSDKADVLLKSSLTKELIASGFNPNQDADLKISGDVQKFEYNWIGFVEVDFYLDVDYLVTKGGKTIYKNTIKTHKAAPKTAGGTDSEAVRSAISSNIGELLQALRDQKII